MNLLHMLGGKTRPRLDLPPMTPRDAAVELLREHLDTGRAGLDPYDVRDFLFDAHADEVTWAAIALNYVGIVVDRRDRESGVRFRAILEADIRSTLGLDDVGAPTMDDEPLASRAVTFGLCGECGTDCRDAAECAKARNASPVLAVIDQAKTAYDRRYPNGVTAVH